MQLDVEHVRVPSRQLRERLVEIWVDATNAGGTLGLLAPTDARAAQLLAGPLWERVARGTDDLVVGRLQGRVAGWFALVRRDGPLSPHWRTVARLQVHPTLQGHGLGTQLLRAADDVALRLGLEALHLTVRGGTGIEGFYFARGYREVGRIPRALRVGAGDDRDEIHLYRDLRGR